MSVLFDTPAVRARVREILDFAQRPENWYRPGPGVPVPGDGTEFTLETGSLRVVFTWTAAPDGAVLRHLSVTTATGISAGFYPAPFIAFTLATWFGFTGARVDRGVALQAGPDWQIVKHPEVPGCLVVGQRIPPEELPS